MSQNFSVKPLANRVILKPEKTDEETKSPSGIIIPPSADTQSEMKKAEVVAVGPGEYREDKLIPVNVKEGDKVLFNSKHSMTFDTIEVDGEKYIILSENQILAVIK